MRTVNLPDLADLIAAHAAARDDPSALPLVVVSGNFATPRTAVMAVDTALPAYRLFAINGQRDLPDRENVIPVTPFVGPGMRDHPALEYVPCRLSLVPRLFATTHRPDIVVLHTSVVRDGKVSLGTEVNILPAAVEAAKAASGLVVAQINPRMPYTYGDAELPLEAIDLAVEVDAALASPAPNPPDATRAAIGSRVADLVPDGATLQLGIGEVPNATLGALTTRLGLRIWTETFSDGVLALERAGALESQTEIVTSFVFGSADLYAWLDQNPRVRLVRTETVNNPAVIARQPAMTSINTALQVDLRAQANASWIRGRVYSGFGGQPDFVAGALHAAGGQAVIALPSWHARTGTSTIVPALTEPATSFQHSYVVTDQGVAELWGAGAHEQARRLVTGAAHPAARDALTESLARHPSPSTTLRN